jgi:K+-sensing histidine kinase KdpD
LSYGKFAHGRKSYATGGTNDEKVPVLRGGQTRRIFFIYFSTGEAISTSYSHLENVTVSNVSRASGEDGKDRIRKGNGVSTLEERRELRDLIASPPDRDTGAPRIRRGGALIDFLSANALPLVATLALVWLATIGLVVLNYFVQLNFVPLIYMVPVVVAATRWGIVAGVVAAVAGTASADFFFYPPLYTFWLSNPQDAIDLTLFLLVAIITSNLAARLKSEAVATGRRAREIKELHSFSQGLATCVNSRDLIFAVQDYLSNTLGYRAVFIASARNDADASATDILVPIATRREADKLIAGGGTQTTTVVDPRSQRRWLIRVITPAMLGYGAIAVELGGGLGDRNAALAQRVQALLDEAMAMLRTLKIKESIEQATIEYRTEVLRDALIGGVSHELRTPLASILGTCSVLNQLPAIRNDCQSHDLIEAIHDQAGQLDNEIRDLLDATRISAKGIKPQLVWADPTDIVNAAVKQKARRLASHCVALDLQCDAPLVYVDSVLIEQALGQILENAAKYSPVGTSIKVAGRTEQGHVVLSVTDQGAGLTPDEKDQLGKRSFRGERQGAGTGSGLGLWIASTFVGANGGTLHAESRGPNLGTTISLRLPVVSQDTPELVDALDE